jgi:hypothetical protein
MASHINDLLRLAAGISAGPVTLATDEVSMPVANTEYSYTIPRHRRKLLFSLGASNAWRVHATTGKVASGAGHQIAAGAGFTLDGPFKEGQVVYFACSSASQTMYITGEQPTADGV